MKPNRTKPDQTKNEILAHYERTNGRLFIHAMVGLLILYERTGTTEVIRHIYGNQLGDMLPAGKRITITFSLQDDDGMELDGHPVDMEIVTQ